MIIEQIDNSKVLIVLGGKEMQDFSLKYNTLSFDDPHSGKILKRLLTLACTKTEVSTRNKKLLVEALPQDKGCIILLTLIPIINRKIYKIKKPKKSFCFLFDSAEKLISASTALCNCYISAKNSLYLFEDKYAIIIEDVYENNGFVKRLFEFSDEVKLGKIYCAKVRENGKLLADNNGIRTIGVHFI